MDNHSQFIIATHSPILLAYPGATICQITDRGIDKCRYEECENYVLTWQFLENPKRMLHYLFERIMFQNRVVLSKHIATLKEEIIRYRKINVHAQKVNVHAPLGLNTTFVVIYCSEWKQ